jgi:hypothetical protein
MLRTVSIRLLSRFGTVEEVEFMIFPRRKEGMTVLDSHSKQEHGLLYSPSSLGNAGQ